MKKILTILMCMLMTVCFMPHMTWAASITPCTGTCEHEAQIGDTHYDTLREAVSSASDGTTVKLLKTVTVSDEITIEKEITLDLNGKTINSEIPQILKITSEGMLTITGNGTINGPANGESYDSRPVICVESGKLSITSGNITINTSGKGSDGMYGIYAKNGAVVTLGDLSTKTGPEIDSFFAAVGTNNTTAPAVITINGGIYTENAAPSPSDWWGYFCAPVYASANGTYTINGGTFSGYYGLSSVYGDAGQDIIINGGTFNGSKKALHIDAKTGIGGGTRTITVNGGLFSTLDEALAYAADNSKIALANDVALTSTLNNYKTLTIDLNGHNIKGKNVRAIHQHEGTLTLTGVGTVTSVSEGNLAESSSVIRVGDNEGTSANLVTGTYVNVNAPDCYGITYFGTDSQTVTINGKVEATGNAAAISGNGSTQYGKAYVTVNGSVIAKSEYAIYNPQDGTLQINGTVKGMGGVEIKSGETTVSVGDNAWIESTSNTVSHEANLNGSSTLGYAIAIVNNSGYKAGASVTVKGGTVLGKMAIIDDDTVVQSKKGKIIVTGGKFTEDPTAFAGTLKTYYKTSDKYYYVNTKPSNSSGCNAWHKSGADDYYTEYWYTAPIGGMPVSSTTNTTTTTATTKAQEQTIAKNSGNAVITNNEAEIMASGLTTSTAAASITTINTSTAKDMVEAAVDGKVTNIDINAATSKGTSTEATVSIPAATVKTISEKAVTDITVNTDVASIVIDHGTQKAIAAQAKGTTVQVAAKKVSQSEAEVKYELSIVSGDTRIYDFNGGNVQVTVAIPTSMKTADLVCVYLDDNGNAEKMSGKKNADGTYTFTTGHFSYYALMTEKAADELIAENLKAQQEKAKQEALNGVKNIKLKVSTKLTDSKSVKISVKVAEGLNELIALHDAGYDIEYKFYRSTKKTSGYKAVKTKKDTNYTNTKGIKGKRYYYKTVLVVKDSAGTVAGKTALKQSGYGTRVWKK